MIDPYQAMKWATVAAVLFAASYLVATRKRSRRAAAISLCGVGLFGLMVASWVTGVWYAEVLRAVGLADRRTPQAVGYWCQSTHMALAYGLLIWAVLADRPPPDGE